MKARASLHHDYQVRIEVDGEHEDLSPGEARLLALQLHAQADKADALYREEERRRKKSTLQ